MHESPDVAADDGPRPLSRIRKIFLAFVAFVALLTFGLPWLVPITPSPFFVMVVVLFGPPLLPLRLPYKLLILVALVVVGPLMLHVRAPQGTADARQLASDDSHFFDTGQIEIHYQVAGQTGERGQTGLVLMHPGQPFGLGTWHKVLPVLAQSATVVAFDRPAAGLTAWPEEGWTGASPYSPQGQADQTVALMDHLNLDHAILIANSAGGTLALLTALRHPERIKALVLISPGVYVGTNDGSPAWARRALGTPQGRRIGRLLARNLAALGPEFYDSFWHDSKGQTPRDKLNYGETFQVHHWDRAFLEMFRTAEPLSLPERLTEVHMPVLVLTGDDDKWIPLEQNQRLASDLPNARLEVLQDCGHLPQQEQPEAFIRAVRSFVREVATTDGL